MRKEIISLLCVALVFVPLSLKAQDEDRPITITIWNPFTGGDGEFFNAMTKAFNAAQDDILLEDTTKRFEGFYPLLNDELTAGMAPDIVVMNQSRLLSYVEEGYILSLDRYIPTTGIDLSTFIPGPLADCRVDDSLYAIPLDVHPLIMYYNRDLFERAGVSKPPETFPELISAAQAVQEETGAIGVAADNTSSTYKAYTLARIFMSLLMQQNTTVLNSSNTKANFNNSAGIRAYQVISDMIYRYQITPLGLDYDFSVSYFKTGMAGIHFNGVWVVGLFEEEENLNFGTAKFPALLGENAAWSGSHIISIIKKESMDEEKITAALSYIDWITAHGELWAKAGHIPTRKTVFRKEEFQALPHRNEYADAVESSFVTPAIPQWTTCYRAMADMLESAIAKNMNAREALNKMEERINRILAE